MIYALYIEGDSLQEYARRVGKSPQSVSSMIASVATRAPEFHGWWREVNAGRQQHAAQGHSRRSNVQPEDASVRLQLLNGFPLALDVDDVARLLGVSPRTVELHARCGNLKYTTANDRQVFAPEDLRAFVDRWLAGGGVFRLRLPPFYGDPWCIRSKRNRPIGAGQVPGSPTSSYRSLRLKSKKLAQYRNSGLFSADELSIVEVHLQGGSLEGWADRHLTSFADVQRRLEDVEARARRAGLPGIGVARRNGRQK